MAGRRMDGGSFSFENNLFCVFEADHDQFFCQESHQERDIMNVLHDFLLPAAVVAGGKDKQE